ncbi:hypothetical protein SCUCBS95973_004154 [Sporothrix curviconia]|uniref:Aminoglycoside phosphotransferase domain-containing protein n=1 Tax=Sporothrix curviconia TaxID=1260050 RepID=A0ABP0BLB1_9PEZI
MPSKPRRTCADKDDLIWEKLDDRIDEWYKSVRANDIYRAVARFILKYRPGDVEVMHLALKGAYNIAYRLEYKDGSSVIMRIPIKDAVPFQDEKVRYEVATMRYVAANTTIPVPHVYHYGMAAENPLGLGPFIIMDYIDHHQNLSRALMDPTRALGKRPILDPNIDDHRLASIYAQVADILLQLDSLRFPRIGSLLEDPATGHIEVRGRPLLANMIDLVVHTDMPEEGILPAVDTTYDTAGAWFTALADVHLAQLVFQRRDAVEDIDDARDKYVARQLFRRAAAGGGFAADDMPVPGSPATLEASEIPEISLFSEDLRPANILLDKDDRIVGVIDWEFAYAAPLSFSSCPPWWLLIEEPESWPVGGISGWQTVYEPRLQTFLAVLENAEKEKQRVSSTDSPTGTAVSWAASLSQRMRASWSSNTWMRNYAARRSWAFDFLWWKYLDEELFGPNEDQDHKARLATLTEDQRNIVEAFVAQKLEEGKDKEITTWEKEDAVVHLAKYLI